MYRILGRGIIVAIAAVLLAFNPALSSVLYKGVADLTAESNRIVIGDIVEITSFWNDDHTLIKSRIVVDVDDYLLGRGTGTETLVMSGGEVDDIGLRVSVLPLFEIGDRVLLFLNDGEIGLVECFQGAYLTDGKQIARTAPGCRKVFGETLQPLDEFLEEIEKALPAGITVPEITPYDGDFSLPEEVLLYALCGRDWTYMSNPMGEDYRINANCVDNQAGDANSQRTQIQNGANAWNGAGADFEFTYGGTSSQTYVSFNNTNLVYFDTTPPDGGGYLAATYMWFSGSNMLECDMVYDDQHWTWWNGSGGCYGYFDIWNIAAHEFGHFLCLDHSSYYLATMYYAASQCETHKRSLHSDDINGITAIYGSADENPPTPNPMTFQSLPAPAGETSISMIATQASDDTPPIQYYFDFYAGGNGGSDRGWSTTRTFTDYGLDPNTEYSYRCKARDDASPPNETSYSSAEAAYTWAEIPGAPLLSNVTTNTIDLDVDPSTNPSYTVFSVICATSDPTWDGKFVDAAGAPSDVEVWRTDDLWAITTVSGLTPNTEYSFQVKARNEDNIETDYGPSASETTLPDAAVPTLGEWGMIILALLLVVGGTVAVVIRRREELSAGERA